MAAETCIELIIHPDFKPDSPLQSILETTSTDQTASDTSASVSKDLAYVVQLISVAKHENSLKAALDTLANKPSILEPVLEPFIQPVSASVTQASIDLGICHKPEWTICSDSDEDMPEIIVDSNPNSSTQTTQDLPSTFTNQPIPDKLTTSQPQTINVSPPPTLLLYSIELQEVCENIFEDLKNLVQARNDPVHTENYEDKWISLRKMVDRVLCEMQRLSVETQNQSLNIWFKEVIRSMEEVEIRRHELYLSNSPFFLDSSSLITSTVKEDLNISWLTQVKVKADIPILEKLKEDLVQIKKIQKLEQDLFEQKMMSEKLKRQMIEMKEEHRAREEAQTRRSDALEETLKKQSEDMMAVMKKMMDVMKKQTQP